MDMVTRKSVAGWWWRVWTISRGWWWWWWVGVCVRGRGCEWVCVCVWVVCGCGFAGGGSYAIRNLILLVLI